MEPVEPVETVGRKAPLDSVNLLAALKVVESLERMERMHPLHEFLHHDLRRSAAPVHGKRKTNVISDMRGTPIFPTRYLNVSETSEASAVGGN